MRQTRRKHQVLRRGCLARTFGLVSQVHKKVVAQIGAARLPQHSSKELFVVAHELSNFFGRVHQVVLKPALLRFLALACAMQVLAGEGARIVRKTALGSAVAAVRKEELAQLLARKPTGLRSKGPLRVCKRVIGCPCARLELARPAHRVEAVLLGLGLLSLLPVLQLLAIGTQLRAFLRLALRVHYRRIS